MDNCCLNRPFDDQSDPRIRLESEAIKTILNILEENVWILVSSDVLKFEINNTSDDQKRNNLFEINNLSKTTVKLTDAIKNRAQEFEGAAGIQAFDAMHLACAENNADILLTTDDRFIKRAEELNELEIKISNPLTWLNEVL